MRLLGYEDPSFTELFGASKEAMSGSYPDIATQFARVSGLALAECVKAELARGLV
jgi:alanyl-tRNA synthetase